jgi:hypothetical protein
MVRLVLVYTGLAYWHACNCHVKCPLGLSEFNKTEVAQNFIEKFQDMFSRSRIAISVKKDGQRDSKRHFAELRTGIKTGKLEVIIRVVSNII